MAQQTINVGTSPNDGTGTPLRTAFQYTNSNFSELYTALGGGTGLPGATTQVIFNDGGTNLAGDAGLVYNKTTDALTIGGNVQAASATITGDLTVATNGLKVDSANKNVGINTATPTNTAGYKTLEIVGTGVNTGGMLRFKSSDTSVNTLDFADSNGRAIFAISNHPVRFGCNDIEQYRINPLGVFTWYDGAGGTRMTLNSTGLGVGASPTAKVHVVGGAAQNPLILDTAGYNHCVLKVSGTNRGQFYADATNCFAVVNSAGSATPFVVTDTGNVGIGVTPSAWWSSTKALQISSSCSLVARTDTASRNYLASNAFLNSTPSWTYLASNTAAARYDQNDGSHQWHIAPSSGVGGAGTAITFTQAMTLSATGQLLLGTSSTNGGVDIGMVMNKPSATGFVGNVYQLNGVDKAFAYIASAASAYTTETVSGYIIRVVSATNGVYLANGGTSWLALSDERFKDIIEPISNAVAKVGSLRSVIGKFKTESEGTRRPFLIAQDVQAVLPEAVDATKPDQLGVSYSDVIPLLVAAIKELTARVQTLETR